MTGLRCKGRAWFWPKTEIFEKIENSRVKFGYESLRDSNLDLSRFGKILDFADLINPFPQKALKRLASLLS